MNGHFCGSILCNGPLGGSLLYILKFSKANSTKSSQADVDNEWALDGSILCNVPLGGSLLTKTYAKCKHSRSQSKLAETVVQ